MLTDNGAPYTAKDTRTFARQLGLRPCFTPVKSPPITLMIAVKPFSKAI